MNKRKKCLPSSACIQFQQITAHSDVDIWIVEQAKRKDIVRKCRIYQINIDQIINPIINC